MIKQVSGSTSISDWRIFDTTRAIVTGNDAILALNSNAAESYGDFIDPDPSGFAVSGSGATNALNETYIFYAIA